ncbi:MAG: glycosyltransferase [Candidatus Bathyarchaeia archaeon]
MRIDVILLTKNSLKPCLNDCLKSIYSNVPVNRLIVVDGGSSDGTIDLISKFPKVKVINDSKGNRATARQKGIDAVETEWHLHVDSDVILCKDWFKKASKYLKDDVGAIWGVAIPIEKHSFNIVYAMSKLYRLPIKDLLLKQIRSERYNTHDTLIRTEAVRGIRIPKDLHVWEDDYIGRYVIKKGFKFLKVKNPYCLHNVSEKRLDALQGYLIHKHQIWNFRKTFMHFLLGIPKAACIYALTMDFEAAKRQALACIMLMKGWLSF